MRADSFFQREADLLTTAGSPPKARLLLSHCRHRASPAEQSWDATCALRSGFRALRDTCCHTAKFSTSSGGNLRANSTWKQKVIETKQIRKQFESLKDEKPKCAAGLLQIYYVKEKCAKYFNKSIFLYEKYLETAISLATYRTSEWLRNLFFQLLEAMALVSRERALVPPGYTERQGEDRTLLWTPDVMRTFTSVTDAMTGHSFCKRGECWCSHTLSKKRFHCYPARLLERPMCFSCFREHICTKQHPQ